MPGAGLPSAEAAISAEVDDEGTIAFFKEVEEDGTRWLDP